MRYRGSQGSESVSLTIRVDQELKDGAGKALENMGLNLTSGVTVFLKTVVRENKIPFEIKGGE